MSGLPHRGDLTPDQVDAWEGECADQFGGPDRLYPTETDPDWFDRFVAQATGRIPWGDR